MRPKILIIYTGGTIGMIQDKNGVLQPFNFENLLSYIPMLKDFPADISSYSFETPKLKRTTTTTTDLSCFTAPTQWLTPLQH